MLGPLLETKMHVPGRRSGIVARPRLVDRLSGASSSARLTLVSAPAGFGKTTLLTDALGAAPADALVAWVSLDDRDNDSGRFWSYVIAALQTAAEGVGAGALALLQSSPAATDEVLATLLNDLQALPCDVVLVLDDYHEIDARDVHDGVDWFLDHLPPNVHLVLATRADPPLPLSRLRARGELIEVRSADLRFTRDEAADYLAGPMGLSLGEADVATLAERTEGWAAALQLAGLSLQDRADPSAAVARFAGDDRFIVDYLAEEVLSRQPDDIREFLLTTSVLHRLTGPLCDAVSGQTGGTARLVALERANLFLVPLDDTRQWYRYHHLFADVLGAHLTEQLPKRVTELHRRASAWLAEHGDAAEAIRHALAGEDFAQAADLMERTMPVMRRERREGELAGWVRSIPQQVLQARPVLALALAGALAQVSEFDTVGQRLDTIERLVRPDGGAWPAQPPSGLVVVDEAGYRSLPATMAMYRAALALNAGDLAATVSHSQEALTLVPPDDDLVRAGAGAIGGLAAWAMGDLVGAHDAYTESAVGMRRAGHFADILGLCITLGDIRSTQGRLEDALRTYRQALDLAAPEPGATPLRGTADMHTGIAGVLLERDHLAAAAEHLDAGESLGEHKGLPQNPYRRRVTLARLREAEGDLDAALELLDEADRVFNSDYSPNVRPVPAVRARLRVRRGELNHAETWARDQSLSPSDALSYLREYEHLTLARLLLAKGEHQDTALEEATGLLSRLLAAAEDGGRGGTVIEVLILQTLAHQARGDVPAALESLRRAVTLAEPEGYVRVFAEEGASLGALLRALAKDEDQRGYVRRLLASAVTSRQASAPDEQPLADPLSERELDVLRLLASDLDGPDIARQLHVSLNTMRTHTKRIYAKLGVTNRQAAVNRGQALRLLPGQRQL